MNKRITIRIYMLIYVKYNMYTSTLYQRMVGSSHRAWKQSLFPPHVGTFKAPLLKPARVLCVARRRGSGGYLRRTGGWGREPNVGAKVWKIAWDIKYHKGCVCVAWNCWRIFVVALWGVFFCEKRCGNLEHLSDFLQRLDHFTSI